MMGGVGHEMGLLRSELLRRLKSKVPFLGGGSAARGGNAPVDTAAATGSRSSY